jgi:hypothetical protein
MIKRSLALSLTAVGLALVLFTGSAAAQTEPAPEPSADNAACANGQWPSDTEGMNPALQPGAPAGIYVWHSDRGWHLYVTHPGEDKATFTGIVHADSGLYAVARRDERNDVVRIRGPRRVDYRFNNYGHIDGMDFKVRCRGHYVKISGRLDGTPLTPDQVFIGADGHHPTSVPFVIERSHA